MKQEPDGAAPVKRLPWLVCAGLLPLLLFCWTLCRTVYWGDSTELAMVAHGAGVAHPTGYPLWSMLAVALASLPGLDAALAVNLLSALCGAGACLVLFLLLRHLEVGPAESLFGVLALATVREVWLQSSIAEVYTLHLLLLGLFWLTAERLYRNPEPRTLGPAALVLGLALCNHMTSALLFVPLTLLLVLGARRGGSGERASAGHWLASAAFLLLGLLPYLYLPLRSLADPWPDYGNPETWEGFRWLVAGSQFRYLMFSSGAGYALEQLRDFLAQLPRQFTPGLLGLALAGAVAGWRVRRTRVMTAALTLHALLVLAHAVNYRIEDNEAYFLPVYLVLAVWVAAGAGLLTGYVRQRLPGWASGALAIGLVLLLTHQGWSAYPAADRRTDRSLEQYSLAVLSSTEQGALVISGDFNVYSAYLYGSMAQGKYVAVDCLLDYLFPFPWYLEQLARIAPHVVVPPAALEAARRDWAAGGQGRGLEHGRQKEQVLIEIKRLIIEANLARRPVYLHMRDDTTMKERWAGIYPLDYRGLTYRVVDGPAAPPPRPWRAEYPMLGDSRPHPYRRAALHKFSDAANRLGVVLVSIGRTNEALETFDRALTYDPENYGVLRNRGLLRLQLLGDRAGAQADFADYLTGWERSGEPEPPEINAIRTFLARQPGGTGDGRQ